MGIPGSLTSLLPAGVDEIPRRLRDIERYITELGPSIAASIKPAMDDIRAQQAITAGLVADLSTAQATLASTVSGLATAQATLATTVTNLGTAQADIIAQQATLTAQQASLTSQLASINALIGAQVAGDALSTDTGSSGVSLTASNANYATVTFTVPAGFTRAIVTGSANMYYAGTAAGVVLYVNINGTAGYKQTSAASFTAISNTTSTVLAVTGGGTFTVSALSAYTGSGSMTAYIATTAWVTYLR